MSGLSDIEVRVQLAPSGNGRAILHEVADLLRQLDESGDESMVDLQGIPLGPADYELLAETLGEGEVAATISTIGRTEVRETRYPGVWRVTHYNVEDDIVADLIEVTRCPEVLKTHPDDVKDSRERLSEWLSSHDA